MDEEREKEISTKNKMSSICSDDITNDFIAVYISDTGHLLSRL